MELAWLVVVVGETIYCKRFMRNIQMKSRLDDLRRDNNIKMEVNCMRYNELKLVHVKWQRYL